MPELGGMCASTGPKKRPEFQGKSPEYLENLYQKGKKLHAAVEAFAKQVEQQKKALSQPESQSTAVNVRPRQRGLLDPWE